MDDNDIIRDAEGAKILGIDNPMGGNQAEPSETELAELAEHLIAQSLGDSIALVEGLKSVMALSGRERSETLLGAQDALIHLIINVHTLIHILGQTRG